MPSYKLRIFYKALGPILTGVICSVIIPVIETQSTWWMGGLIVALGVVIFGNYKLIRLDEQDRKEMVKKEKIEQAKRIYTAQKNESTLRHVLVGLRNLIEARIQTIDKLISQNFSFSPETGINLVKLVLDFDDLMQKIIKSIFNVYSEGHSNHAHRFVVSFMDIDDGDLKIQYWENIDGAVPETKSKGLSFKKGEGCAGQAWLQGKNIYEPDVENPKYFVIKTERHRYEVKSMLSVPVIHRTVNEGEIFFGVINIDTTIKEFFKDTQECREETETKLRPYIYFIALAYRIKELVQKYYGFKITKLNERR